MAPESTASLDNCDARSRNSTESPFRFTIDQVSITRTHLTHSSDTPDESKAEDGGNCGAASQLDLASSDVIRGS